MRENIYFKYLDKKQRKYKGTVKCCKMNIDYWVVQFICESSIYIILMFKLSLFSSSSSSYTFLFLTIPRTKSWPASFCTKGNSLQDPRDGSEADTTLSNNIIGNFPNLILRST
uniref:Uncharacterized protein n=1 Tax=Cacopsylla melanoneura TaxID=428564 RepID=A0A8D8SFU3_9HEMI